MLLVPLIGGREPPKILDIAPPQDFGGKKDKTYQYCLKAMTKSFKIQMFDVKTALALQDE